MRTSARAAETLGNNNIIYSGLRNYGKQYYLDIAVTKPKFISIRGNVYARGKTVVNNETVDQNSPTQGIGLVPLT